MSFRRWSIALVMSIALAISLSKPSRASAQRGPNKASTPAPLAVAASTVSQGVVSITWPAVQKAGTYEVMRCEGTACAVKTSPRISAGQPLEYRDNLTVSGTYLYRVTAFGSNQLPLAEGQVGYVYTAPATAVLMPPPSGTAMVTPAGPSQLTAVSPVPGQIHLAWSPVANAYAYRILKSTGTANWPPRDIPAATHVLINGLVTHIDAPVDLRWTYDYKVYAVFQTATGEVLSASSPVASAKSLPFVQVSGLSYTAVPSTTSLGLLDVTLRWNGVPNAISYYIRDLAGGALGQVGPYPSPPTVYVMRGVPPKWSGYVICVGAEYAYHVVDDKTAPCIELKF